ncbi:hypothetical protein LINPERPRIM_LOCUS10119 [Linum perenne]
MRSRQLPSGTALSQTSRCLGVFSLDLVRTYLRQSPSSGGGCGKPAMMLSSLNSSILLRLLSEPLSPRPKNFRAPLPPVHPLSPLPPMGLPCPSEIGLPPLQGGSKSMLMLALDPTRWVVP